MSTDSVLRYSKISWKWFCKIFIDMAFYWMIAVALRMTVLRGNPNIPNRHLLTVDEAILYFVPVYFFFVILTVAARHTIRCSFHDDGVHVPQSRLRNISTKGIIPYDKHLQVTVAQDWLDRLLGIATIQISAGYNGAVIRLEGLSLENAKKMEAELVSRVRT